MGNVEVRKNKEGYELNLNALIYSELLMSNVRFLVTNQICRVLMIGKSDTRFHQAFPARHRKGIPLEITFLIAGYE